MIIDYNLSPHQLSNAIDNTIRVFNEYQLINKTDSKGRQIIMDKSWMGTFRYIIVETAEGSQLNIQAVAAKEVSSDVLSGHEESFLRNLFKIIDKEIAITPEIANRNIYKNTQVGSGWRTLMWVILIILMIARSMQTCTRT